MKLIIFGCRSDVRNVANAVNGEEYADYIVWLSLDRL